MTRLVFCKKFQQELEGLEKPPLPGAVGEDIFQHISKQAWQEWITHQTRLINEKHLNMMDPEARKFLSEQRELFFNNQSFEQALGYIPENEK